MFYESLYNQVPGSEMTALWMMEWGLLPLDEAKKVYENKLKKNQQQKLRSPVKAASVEVTRNGTAKKPQKIVQETEMKVSRKRKARDFQEEEEKYDDDDDDDFVLSKIAKKPRASS